MEFFQEAPVLKNQYLSDKVLLSYLKHYLPPDILKSIEADLIRLGDRVTTDILEMAEDAEAHPPVHNPYGPWGKRIDEVKVSRGWQQLDKVSAEEGLVSIGHERMQGEYSRLYQFAKLYLFHPSSAIYTCPLAMTDGAARLIELYGSEEMKKRAYPHLISRDPKNFWTSGQWMTERTGGSDVSGTSTVARMEDGTYRLYGVKWFTSASTSQMAMTLARIEGEEKLSLFYLELRNDQGELQNIQVNRLKDKLGTKALPTAELTLTGTPAVLVGERGKGVRTIATLFNITRVYNACCAVGYMRRGLALAHDYAYKRKAFGKLLIDHGLHVKTLVDLQVRFEASFHLTFHTIKLLGKEDTGKASANESGTLRLLIPLAKLFTAKEGVHVASEILESFGGAGYIEDTGLPALLRNAQVLAIWEGTTNVLSLDTLRAIRKEKAADYFMKELELILQKIKRPELTVLRMKVEAASGELETFFKLSKSWSEEEINSKARSIALSLARTFTAALLLQHADWELQNNESRAQKIAERWIEKDLIEPDLSRQEDGLTLRSLL
jgi:alkylation response protein AidB-like acyl-CoA dehydrogenase